uniref:Uncharacterized protein n=1 Tax=Ditylenchus dipsaci TaxID=166011 RepID=A0A915D8T3_9BILA
MTSHTLKHILEKTTQLRILSIVNCVHITDFSCLANCPALGELEIKKTTQLSDLDVEALARNATLKRLRLEQCLNVTNKAVLTIAACCPLIELELSKCDSIEEDIFSKNVWKKLHLQILSLNGTLNITNSLRELDLSHNKNIDDTAIQCLHAVKRGAKKASKRLIIMCSKQG